MRAAAWEPLAEAAYMLDREDEFVSALERAFDRHLEKTGASGGALVCLARVDRAAKTRNPGRLSAQLRYKRSERCGKPPRGGSQKRVPFGFNSGKLNLKIGHLF
jgi:hypothetical protein